MRSQRPLFTISIAAELLQIHPRTLMSYERAGIVIPHRTSGKRRLYSYEDIQNISFIMYLTQNKGVNLAGVKLILAAINQAKQEGIDLMKSVFSDFHPRKLD
jgi:MerR family transcriptional regulator/heat shock protein HspR